MDFKEYDDRASQTAIYNRSGEFNRLGYPVFGLLSEAGEVAGKLKKVMRDNDCELTPEHRSGLAAELGDVLWYLSRVAAELGYTLEEIAIANLEKLESRKKRGKLGGSGDNR